MEILVVIVVFLIGILAVVQIFPRGFALLLTTRNNSAATALGRDMVERLKSNPDLIPDEIVPVYYSNGNPYVDTTLDPTALGPQGDGINAQGQLLKGGVVASDDWMLASGPNAARRIVGEGHRLPAARAIGSTASIESYGALLMLDHGPAAVNSPLVAYANDLSRTFGAPRDAETPSSTTSSVSAVSDSGASVTLMSADGSAVVSSLPASLALTDPVTLAPYEYFVVNPSTSDAAVFLPATRNIARSYRIRMSAYLGTPAAVKRYDYLSLCIRVPAITNANYALVRVRLADLLANTTEVMNGSAMYAVDPDSVQVAPQYVNLSTGGTLGQWTKNTTGAAIDPFEMKVTDANLGVLLFSPAGREGVVERPGGTSEPLIARVDYDVRDWRIIGEEFRVVNGSVTFPLSLQSIKVGSNQGPDGLPNGGLFTVKRAQADTSSIDPAPSPRDNVVVVDLTTGFEVQRYRTDTTDANGRTYADVPGGSSIDPASILVYVDKSRGSLTLRDALVGNTNAAGVDPVDVRLIPPTGAPITVSSENRTFRVLYRARQEWAVQVMKGASRYSVVNTLPNSLSFASDQCFVGDGTGGTNGGRLYFPASEAGHKVTIDRIVYRIGSSLPQTLEGQDFVLQRGGNEVTSFAYADLGQVVSGATFSNDYGTAVQGVKGASLSVRVLWNPEAFTFSADTGTNVQRAVVWGRGWRKSTTETYLRAEETR